MRVKFYFDLDLRRFVTRAGFTGELDSATFKRGDAETLQVEFWRGGAAVTLASADDIIFGLKKTHTGDLLASADAWTEADGVYSAAFDTNTQEILDELGGLALLSCLGELTFSEDGGASWTSSQTLDVSIENDVNKESDGAPTSLPGPDDWLNARGLRIDQAQSLSEAQMAQGRQNLGLPSGKSEFEGVGAPGASDDETAGFSEGSLWFDTVAKEWYRCVSAAAGAADWIETTLEPSELHAVAVSGDYDDLSDTPFLWNNPWSFYDAQANVDMGSYNLSFNGGAAAFSYNTGSYRLELSTDFSVGPFGSLECGYLNGMGMNLDVLSGELSDNGNTLAIGVDSRRLYDDWGVEVMDWTRDTPDADIKISAPITMGGSNSDRTIHLYYLKDDPNNPASFIADLSSGYFNLASGVLQVNGTPGANFGPGMPTTMTIVDGIVTAAS